MKRLLNITKYSISFLTLLGFVLAPFVVNADSKDFSVSDPNTMVCEALGRIGIGCGSTTPSPILTNNKSNNSNLFASVYNLWTKNKREGSVLVRVINQAEVYEIIGGKRHFIPTKEIFYDYGFKDELIQNITTEELSKYPPVKLLKVEGNKKTYYLTDGQMLRLIPNNKIFNSYGNREEDIVTISKKEFNYYPQNQFIFLEKSLNRGVFQIVDGKKIYLSPMAIERMKIRPNVIAPVNETELTYYKTGPPIVF